MNSYIFHDNYKIKAIFLIQHLYFYQYNHIFNLKDRSKIATEFQYIFDFITLKK
jgi:hypothetical protein